MSDKKDIKLLTPILSWSGKIWELRKIIKKMKFPKKSQLIIIDEKNEKTYFPKTFAWSSKGDLVLYLEN